MRKPTDLACKGIHDRVKGCRSVERPISTHSQTAHATGLDLACPCVTSRLPCPGAQPARTRRAARRYRPWLLPTPSISYLCSACTSAHLRRRAGGGSAPCSLSRSLRCFGVASARSAAQTCGADLRHACHHKCWRWSPVAATSSSLGACAQASRSNTPPSCHGTNCCAPYHPAARG